MVVVAVLELAKVHVPGAVLVGGQAVTVSVNVVLELEGLGMLVKPCAGTQGVIVLAELTGFI